MNARGRILSALAAASMALSPVAAAQVPPDDLFKPMTTDQIDQFVDALRSNIPLAIRPQNSSQQVDSDLAGLWAGSKTKVESSMGPLVLRFRPKTDVLLSLADVGGVAEKTVLDYFDVTVTMKGGRVVVEHSHFSDRRDVGGVLSRIDRLKDPTRSAFIQGQKQSGFYVSIPTARDPMASWGFMVCPREMSVEFLGGSRSISLKPSSYELSEVMSTADMSVQSTLATAGQKGKVSVQLFASPGLPEPKSKRDEAVSTVPTGALLYSPATPFDFSRFAPSHDVQLGLVALVEMQNKVGYIRRHYFSHQRLLHRTDEPSPVKLVIGRTAVRSDLGDCYMVFEQRYSWMTYDKQPATFK